MRTASAKRSTCAKYPSAQITMYFIRDHLPSRCLRDGLWVTDRRGCTTRRGLLGSYPEQHKGPVSNGRGFLLWCGALSLPISIVRRLAAGATLGANDEPAFLRRQSRNPAAKWQRRIHRPLLY